MPLAPDAEHWIAMGDLRAVLNQSVLSSTWEVMGTILLVIGTLNQWPDYL